MTAECLSATLEFTSQSFAVWSMDDEAMKFCWWCEGIGLRNVSLSSLTKNLLISWLSANKQKATQEKTYTRMVEIDAPHWLCVVCVRGNARCTGKVPQLHRAIACGRCKVRTMRMKLKPRQPILVTLATHDQITLGIALASKSRRPMQWRRFASSGEKRQRIQRSSDL